MDVDRAIIAARQNEPWAWECIYRHLAPMVMRWLRAERPDLAEDVLGETFVAVVRDFATFDGDAGGLRAWVFAIARHRMMDACRSEQRRPQRALTVDAAEINEIRCRALDFSDTSIARIDAERAVDLLAEALASLPEPQRVAIWLRYAFDMSITEIGRVLGIGDGAVRMLQNRALVQLAAAMSHASIADAV